jgi:hypothetical protein
MIDAIANFIEGNCRTKPRTWGGEGHTDRPACPEAAKPEQRFGFWGVPLAGPSRANAPTATVKSLLSMAGAGPLIYDPPRAWHCFNNIESNRTHRYVIFVDGKPSYDKTCDGLVVPQSPDEARCQMVTPKGPRVMLLFALASPGRQPRTTREYQLVCPGLAQPRGRGSRNDPVIRPILPSSLFDRCGWLLTILFSRRTRDEERPFPMSVRHCSTLTE